MRKIDLLAILALICAGFAGVQTSLAASMIDIQGAVAPDGGLGTVRAVVDPSITSFAIKVNGQAPESEVDKCKTLLEIAGDDPSGVMANAASPLTASVTFSESRDPKTVGSEWKEGLLKLARALGVSFNSQDIDSYFPLIEEIRLDVDSESFGSVSISKASRAYLNSRFVAAVQDSFTKQVKDFNSTGVLRFETDDQSVVCYSLLLKGASIRLSFLGRTLDLEKHVAILDQDCLRSITAGANDYLKGLSAEISWPVTKEEFAFLMGAAFAESQEKNRSFFSRRTLDLCVLPAGESLYTHADAQAEWMKLLGVWFEAADKGKSFIIDKESLARVQSFGQRTDLLRTTISYNYELKFGG